VKTWCKAMNVNRQTRSSIASHPRFAGFEFNTNRDKPRQLIAPCVWISYEMHIKSYKPCQALLQAMRNGWPAEEDDKPPPRCPSPCVLPLTKFTCKADGGGMQATCQTRYTLPTRASRLENNSSPTQAGG